MSALSVAAPRLPYVQQVQSDSALVAVRLDSDCAVTVRYGPGTDRSQVAQSPSGRLHAVRLDKLTPSTEIGYELLACGERVGPVGSFLTAPPSNAQSIHFAAAGDFGTGHERQTQLEARLIADDPDLFLALGDIAYDTGTAAEVENRFFTPMQRLYARVPVYVALGNHEYMTDNGKPSLDAVFMPTNSATNSERFYSFDRGPVHFVALDSMCIGGVNTSDCTVAQQKAWLEQDLAKTTKPWKVVFFHHSPYTSSPKDLKAVRDLMIPVFQKHGVDLVLAGHAHNYERSHPLWSDQVDQQKGITYIVAGAGGAKFKEFTSSTRPAWSAYRNNTDFGYLDVRIDGGTLSAEARTITGGTIDRFTITKSLPAPTDPTEPTDPSEPVDPSEPTDPAQPVDPNEPRDPTQPVEPTQPSQPGGGETVVLPPDGGLSCTTGSAATLLPMLALGAGALIRRRRSAKKQLD